MLLPADMKEKLLAQRRALLVRVARTEEDLHWLDANLEIEIEDEGQEASIAGLLAMLDDRGRREIEEIDRALARIANNDYGRCSDCGSNIPPARLEALPAADTCVACAQARERAPGG